MLAVTTDKAIKYILTAAGAAAGLFLLPFLLKVFAPFTAAFAIAAPCQGIVRWLEKRLRLSRGISSAVIATLIVAVASGIVLALSFKLFSQAKGLVSALPAALSSFRAQFFALSQKWNGFKSGLSTEAAVFLDTAAAKLGEYSSEFLNRLTEAAINAAGSFAASLPSLALFLAMFILATFFFTKDYLLIINFLKELLPSSAVKKLAEAKRFLGRAFSSYLKAQLILMGLTSALVTVSLWIIGKSYALLWGLICGIVDALPFFGTAAVLVPWALVAFGYGDIHTFVALLIIQALAFTVRELAEPKIVSRQIGIHPILTLISVYVGLRYFGVVGMILAPVLTLLLVNFYVSYREGSSTPPQGPR